MAQLSTPVSQSNNQTTWVAPAKQMVISLMSDHAVKSTPPCIGAIYWNGFSAFLKSMKFMNNFEYVVGIWNKNTAHMLPFWYCCQGVKYLHRGCRSKAAAFFIMFWGCIRFKHRTTRWCLWDTEGRQKKHQSLNVSPSEGYVMNRFSGYASGKASNATSN